jgi:hypothetical protein
MSRTVTYKDVNGDTKEHTFGEDVEEVNLTGDPEYPGFALIGFVEGDTNEVVEKVDEVVDSGIFSI